MHTRFNTSARSLSYFGRTPNLPPVRGRTRFAGCDAGVSAVSNYPELSGKVRASLWRTRPRQLAQGDAPRCAGIIRRLLLHVLPRGFMRIRHYGLIANRAKREKLAQARTALDRPRAAEP